MRPAFTASPISIKLHGTVVPGAGDRQKLIPGFDQDTYSKSLVLCIGAGGIVSQIAPTLVRKGIGGITLLDDDIVEPSNLNRQRFYMKDLGENKAVALARNLEPECIEATEIRGIPLRFQEAVAGNIDLACDVAVCGVDNNPARVAACRYFRKKKVPIIFAAVSREGDHGFVFVQDRDGPCLACMFPDMAGDDRFPCPGTPAIADILQAVGALSVYALDTVLMSRPRTWNYRSLRLSDPALDGGSVVPRRSACPLCAPRHSAEHSDLHR